MQKTTSLSLKHLQSDFAEFTFKTGGVFHWSPLERTIYYPEGALSTRQGMSQLLHELGHAILGHSQYTSGVQLLKLEAEAWEEAGNIAAQYGTTISDGRTQHCLDTYRDWLHLRSTCPNCQTPSPEVETDRYRCFNCRQIWSVSADQQTRKYRQKRKV